MLFILKIVLLGQIYLIFENKDIFFQFEEGWMDLVC